MSKGTKTVDAIIIGGGPAGLSAAFWCAELGLKTVLFEKEREFGGQLLRTHNIIRNYIGIEGATGRELRDVFVKQSDHLTYDRVLAADIKSVDLVGKSVELADGARYVGRALVIATGVRRKKLGIPGEQEFVARGILDSGVGEKDKVVGKRVAIVGGGDAALENAILLSEQAEKVFLIHRRSEFSGRSEFVRQATNNEKIVLLEPSVLDAIVGEKFVEAVAVRNCLTGERTTLPVEFVLIRIGVEPNTELFRQQIDLDQAGYVRVDNTCATNLKGIFAIGDVAHPTAPTISSAVGMGATAAKAIALFCES